MLEVGGIKTLLLKQTNKQTTLKAALSLKTTLFFKKKWSLVFFINKTIAIQGYL